ncbi:uncharacterized protein LOC133888402 [Phragmites australis]|uniref:uncharacterized protein LOC133888402 n=1 Tax=Phragmites australis TaxID=29695 RepID=UPI002D798EFD|nr:uncharacterized protein LOC133888402 [Phragmites australis]
MSRFFSPRSQLTAAAAIVEARLPRPSMTFYDPSSDHCSGSMHFMLLDRDKVLATDQTGRASVYHAGLHALRTAPTLTRPKHRPVSVAVGDSSLYVLDSTSRTPGGPKEEHCFEALVYERGRLYNDVFWEHDWCCHSLPTPPYRPSAIHAYTVFGGSDLWVSTEDEGTYSFDTARGAWANQGHWKLPFRGLAHYVPEYKLWFGLSRSNSKGRHNLFCAFDLATAAKRQSTPVPRNAWKDLWPPKEWMPDTSFLVHLGSARFCIARFFGNYRRDHPCQMDADAEHETLAVFTAVEVQPCGKTGKGLQMIKYKSECYNLGGGIDQWVL